MHGLYMRVSTELQASEGNSLDAQREKLLLHCQGQGWHVCESHIYTDAGISGKSADNRPALQAMREAAKTGAIQRIVVTKFDRLARNTKDLLEIVEELDKAGCALVLLDLNIDTGTPTGKMIATIMGSLAEWERKLIGERVMTGKRQQAKDGEYNGSRIPLGYNYDGEQWTINDQAETIRQIFASFLSGKSLKAIADRLNDENGATARGAKWSHQAVKYILRNGIYAGISQWDGVEVDGEYDAIVTKEEYETVQTMLASLRPGRRW
jgi:site-specific DNA recombinase